VPREVQLRAAATLRAALRAVLGRAARMPHWQSVDPCVQSAVMSEHRGSVRVFTESGPVRIAEIAAGPVAFTATFILSPRFRGWLTRSLPGWLRENVVLVVSICVLLALALLFFLIRARRQHRSLQSRLEQEIEAKEASESQNEARQADLLERLSESERRHAVEVASLTAETERLRMEPKARDKEQFARFLQTIPPDSRVIATLRNCWPLTSLKKSFLDPLYDYLARAREADLEFIDEELEDARRSFSAVLREFSGHLSSIIWQSREQPYEDDTLYEMATEWQGTNPERWREAVDTSDRLAGELVEAYDHLIRLGRRRGL